MCQQCEEKKRKVDEFLKILPECLKADREMLLKNRDIPVLGCPDYDFKKLNRGGFRDCY